MLELPARILADALAPAAARWSEARERDILRGGRPLPPGLQSFAAELGITDPRTLRLEITPRVPVPAPDPVIRLARSLGLPVFHPSGIALGRAVCAVNDRPQLLRHELVHLLQYQRFGGHLPFMRQYLFECLHLGYADCPLEREARRLSA